MPQSSETLQKIIGLLNPGAMGTTVGRSLKAGSHRVVWAGDNRSPESHERAQQSDLEDVATVRSLVKHSDIIFSICPPHAAIDTASLVADESFNGIYVDANAISVDTTSRIKSIIEAGGAHFVDGGIVGPPAKKAGTTRLYLSGQHATKIAPLLEDGLLPGIVISDKSGDASALKMAYAAYTKGHSALLLLSRALARANGIEQNLLDEWALSQPHLDDLCQGEGVVAAKKAWRFNGEMREIASTMDSANLPAEFHLGAAKLYDQLAGFRDGSDLPTVDEVLERLVGSGE